MPDTQQKRLVLVMRAIAIITMTAIIPAFFPFAWYQRLHGLMNIGELPNLPVTGYLTRYVCLLYFFHGAITYYLTLDVKKYLPVIRFLAIAEIVFGIMVILQDAIVGLPIFWVIGEGLSIIMVGVIFYVLAAKIDKD